MKPFYRIFFLGMAAAAGAVTTAHAQPCEPLFKYDTLVVGVAESAMWLTSANAGATYTTLLWDTPWASISPAGEQLAVQVIESNESVTARTGRIYIDHGSCRDSIILIQPGKTCEQGIDGTEGKLFFVGFSENINSNPRLNLIMTASQEASGTISLPRSVYSTTFTVPANAVSTVTMTPTASFCVSTGEVVEDKGLLVQTDKKISLYASNSESKSSDATNILPVEALGDEYYTMSYNAHRGNGTQLVATPEEILIVATEDHTLVTIVPASETGGASGSATVRRAAGDPFTIRLQRGQTYLIKSYLDGVPDNASYFRSITGTYIKATKLIAVFGGHKRAKIGCPDGSNNNPSRDNLYQQLSPLRLWGTRYAVVSTGMTEDLYRIVAAYNNTSFTINGVAQLPLQRGEYRDYTVPQSEHRFIEADKPVQAGLFGESQTCFGVTRGDPFMLALNPVENEITGVTFAALPLADIRDQYATIIVQQTATGAVTLTDASHTPLPLTFYTIPGSGYAYARVQIAHGAHHLQSSVGFTAYVYGFGDAESYAYSVGARFNHLTPPDIQPDTAYCVGQTPKQLAEYTIAEGALLWYDSLDAERPLNDSLPTLRTDSAQTRTFWVSRTVDCSESPRRALTVTVHPLPGITFLDSVACNVNTEWSMAFPEGGSYTGAGCANNHFYPAVAGLGTHTVTYTYEDEHMCIDSRTDTVTVVDFPSQPTISAGSTVSFCEGGAVVLSVDAPDAISYQWYRNGTAVADSAATHFVAAQSGTYTVMAKCLMYPSNPIVVTVYPLPGLPAITAAGATAFCAGDSAILTADAANADSYLWFLNANLIPGTGGNRLVATSTGTYTVQAQNTAGCGSGWSAPVPLTVWPLPLPPVVSLTGNDTFCAGDSAILTASGAGTLTAQWRRDGLPLAGTDGNRYIIRESGIYTLRVEDEHQCRAASNAIAVTVHPLPATPVIYSAQPTALCQGDTALLQFDTFTHLQYQWYRNTVPITVATANTYAVTETGTYTLRVEDGNRCLSPLSNALTIIVHRRPDNPVLTAVGATSFCPGQSVVLDAVSAGALAYYWSRDGEPVAVTSEAEIRVDAAGLYSVTVRGEGNCPALRTGDTIRITLFDVPADPQWLHSSAASFCEGGTLMLIASSAGAVAYEWYKDNRQIAGATDDTYTVSGTGTYTVRALNAQACYSNQSAELLPVTVYSLPIPPVITSSGAPPFYRGWDYTLAVGHPENGIRYDWYKDGIATGMAGWQYPLPMLTDAGAGEYRVEAVSEQDCRTWSEPFEVIADPSPLFIPNVFTPNGDGVNDYFRIAGLEHYDGCDLQVINKRGKTVYSTINYRNDWYGDDLPDDIYYYHLQLRHKDGDMSTHDGYVHVKRR
jgi:gliding motility-associated-like protein